MSNKETIGIILAILLIAVLSFVAGWSSGGESTEQFAVKHGSAHWGGDADGKPEIVWNNSLTN